MLKKLRQTLYNKKNLFFMLSKMEKTRVKDVIIHFDNTRIFCYHRDRK